MLYNTSQHQRGKSGAFERDHLEDPPKRRTWRFFFHVERELVVAAKDTREVFGVSRRKVVIECMHRTVSMIAQDVSRFHVIRDKNWRWPTTRYSEYWCSPKLLLESW